MVKLRTLDEIAKETGLTKHFFQKNAKSMGAINGRFDPRLVRIFLLTESLYRMENSGGKDNVSVEVRNIVAEILAEIGITNN